MANDLSNIMPKILARGLMVLRERCIMPRLVNGDYSAEAKQKGDTIDVPIPATVSALAVVPAITPIAAVDHDPTKVQISLDQWYQNYPVHLTDKELTEVDKQQNYLPMQLGAAVKGIANQVNQSIFAKYKGNLRGVYGWQGTAGTTPFATVSDATGARKILHGQLCPRDQRRGVLDFDAEAKALDLTAFSDAEKIGDKSVKIEGEIGRKFGINWYSDDHVPTHTAGTLVDGAAAKTMAVNEGSAGDRAIGTTYMNMDEGAATSAVGTILVGDVISFAGHSQTYVVVASTQSSAQYSAGVYTAAANAIADLEFYPGLKVAVADDEVMTIKDTHVVNLVFHRDAFAFATRPLVASTQDLALGSKIMAMQDPHTGLTLRLEVSRQHKQVAWEFDMLWGCELVRPELAMRLAG